MEIQKKHIIIGVSVLAICSYFLFAKPLTKKVLPKGTKYLDDADTTGNFSAKQKVSLLYEAMNRYTGTDEKLIVETLTGVTEQQFAQISKLWGLKNYNSTLGYNTYFGTKLPLKSWLREELSNEDYSFLRKKFPNYL